MALNENEQLVGFMFDEAMKLRDASDFAAARQRLLALLEQLTTADKILFPQAHAQLGYICKQLGDRESEEAHFRAASSAAPRWDIASLGLFHALYNQKRTAEAFAEMVRFLRGRHSRHYEVMLEGMFDDTDPAVLRTKYTPEQARLLREARELLTRVRGN